MKLLGWNNISKHQDFHFFSLNAIFKKCVAWSIRYKL